MGQFILKRDNIQLGLIIGLLSPFLGMLIYYYWKIHPFTWKEFFHLLSTNKQLVTSLTMVCLFVNVAIFTVYINTRRDKTAKGIFAMTVIFAIASLLFKYLN